MIFNATPSPPLPADGHIQFLWCIAGTLLWFWIDRRLFWKGSICSWWWMRRGAGWKNGSTIDLCCLGGIDHLYIVFLSLAGTAPIAQLWTVGRQEGATETIQIQIHIQRLHQPSNGKKILYLKLPRGFMGIRYTIDCPLFLTYIFCYKIHFFMHGETWRSARKTTRFTFSCIVN